MKVIAYARFSSNGQDISSIERQHEAAKKYAATHGLTITEWPADEARSAFHGHNKRFGELGKIYARVAAGEIGEGDKIIVEAVDRLSREDVFSALDSFLMMINAGVTIITTMDGQVLNRANYQEQWTRIIAVMANMAQAHQDSKVKSERGLSNWTERRSKGVLTLMPPAWLDKDKNHRPDRVATVQEAFALALQGHGCATIQKRFNARPDFKSWGSEKTSQTWSSSYISRLLRNRAVIGECQPYSGSDKTPVGPVVQDYWPRIVDQDVFDKVQVKLSQRKFAGPGSGRKGKDGESVNIFRSLMVCEQCERSMILLHSGKYPYLKCSGGRSGACDHKRGYHYPLLEKAFLEAVIEIEIDPAGRSVEYAIKNEIATVQNDIVTLGENIAFGLDQMFKNKSDALAQRVADYETELAAKKVELNGLKQRLIIEASPMDQSQRQIKDLWSKLENDDQGSIRQSIHGKLTEMTKFMAMTPNGNLVFGLRDGVAYILVRTRPEGLRIKGKFPLDRYEWKCVRLTAEENPQIAA